MLKKDYLVTYVYKCDDGSWGFGNEIFEQLRKPNIKAYEYFRSQIIYRNNRILIQRKTQYKEVIIINIIKI